MKRLLAGLLVCAAPIPALAQTQLNDGRGWATVTDFPITGVQERSTNHLALVEHQLQADSAVVQTGLYNRAALLQYGNDKFALVDQLGRYNRALIVHVASAVTDTQTTEVLQRGQADTVNYEFTFQTIIDDPDPIAQQFARLSFEQAKTVAENFIFAPEQSRLKAGVLEDISWHFISVLEQRLDQQRLLAADAPFFATMSYAQMNRDASLGALGYRQDLRSLTVGAEVPLTAKHRLGAALSVTDADANIDQRLGTLDTTGYQFGVFGTFNHAPWFVDVLATVTKAELSSRRFSGATQVRSASDGWGYGGRVQAGYRVERDPLAFSPLLSLSYTEGSVDAYTERGSVLLAQHFDKQRRERLLGSIGALLDHQGRLGEQLVQTYVKAELERDFGIGRSKEFSSRFAFSPDRPILSPLDDVSEDTYARFSAGISTAASERLRFSFAGTARFGSEQPDHYGLHGQMALSF